MSRFASPEIAESVSHTFPIHNSEWKILLYNTQFLLPLCADDAFDNVLKVFVRVTVQLIAQLGSPRTQDGPPRT